MGLKKSLALAREECSMSTLGKDDLDENQRNINH